MATLDNQINQIVFKFPFLPVYVAGDFNSKVGTLNQLLTEIVVDSWYICEERNSLDMKIDRRGDKLNFMMESNGLILKNGRSECDCPVNYTFVSKIGKSIVDSFWSNLMGAQFIRDLNVDSIATSSDQFPVIVSFNIYTNSDKITLGVKWNFNKKN